ncbi:hypothetical protein HK405_001198, partial [Cladochytrium tenue]
PPGAAHGGLSSAAVIDVLAVVDDACVRLGVQLDDLNSGSEGSGGAACDKVDDKGRLLQLLSAGRAACVAFTAKRWINIAVSGGAVQKIPSPGDDVTVLFTGLVLDSKDVNKRPSSAYYGGKTGGGRRGA